MNRNPGFNMNNSLSNNIFNGTGLFIFTQMSFCKTLLEAQIGCAFINFSLCVRADGSENVTGLDLSDFPALADRSRRDGSSNPTPLLNPLAGRAPYGKRNLCECEATDLNVLCFHYILH